MRETKLSFRKNQVKKMILIDLSINVVRKMEREKEIDDEFDEWQTEL